MNVPYDVADLDAFMRAAIEFDDDHGLPQFDAGNIGGRHRVSEDVPLYGQVELFQVAVAEVVIFRGRDVACEVRRAGRDSNRQSVPEETVTGAAA